MEKRFIKATEAYCTIDNHLAAPLMRKSFVISAPVKSARISICGLGFYLLTVNGKNITKGHIAPYISNPDHYCYYDEYDVGELLTEGENVLGIILGNGFMNAMGGAVWDFDKADFRGAPRLALEFFADTEAGEVSFFADESFRTHPSAILFDDLRLGEIYDAREELSGWNLQGFDDADWPFALIAEAPKGELKLCEAEPVTVYKELRPLSVTKHGEGYLYDFGINTAGVCRLDIRAEEGQRITLWHGEYLRDGVFNNDCIRFSLDRYPYYREYNQTVRYIASGKGLESYTPHFSYYGFRYVLVEGITEEQATKELLTYLVMSSALPTIGGFSCSNERVNTLFRMVKNADRSNFFYFPTDCPHREKNGWTGDASMSADHMLLMHDTSRSWQVWLDNIRKAQNEDGALPGIVPTAGWGFAWGNGPLWDSVLFNLPYELYKRRGLLEPIRQNASAMLKYLSYIQTRRSADGTVAIGLGDWCQVDSGDSGKCDSPLKVTDTVTVMDMAGKAAEMLAAVGMNKEAELAGALYTDMRETFRRELVDFDTMTVCGACQTSQSAALYYGVFNEDEKERAFSRLCDFVEEKKGKMAAGLLGLHCIFHVLSDYGRSELAYEMIMGDGYPSYTHLIDVGETALVEKFMPDPYDCLSHNHHFLGDISRWFTNRIAGLTVVDHTTVKVTPMAVASIDHAEAWYDLPAGRVTVSQTRDKDGTPVITVTAPEGVKVLR